MSPEVAKSVSCVKLAATEEEILDEIEIERFQRNHARGRILKKERKSSTWMNFMMDND